ncbi:CxxH/CxxC protein [Kurthia zopfii]|uniref:CxxH/CxxC protein n=1 Tax=Kurthia zopfii TaxID=1650 RepID=UPI000F715761|nr:CxxH/CxxC protein [Kurthia zopfii]VEI05413.1 CxxH/CxxC protein, BA_5709 family [Kurthia zopfii]
MEIKSCENHVGHALDVFVGNEKYFPIMDKLSEEEQLSTKCEYCDERAEYLVGNK